MGADGVVIGTAELVALGCIRCGACESGRGCAGHRDDRRRTAGDGLRRVVYAAAGEPLHAWRQMLVEYLYRLGLGSVASLRGRTDLLSHLDYETT